MNFVTSHALAKDLLEMPDGFITATVGEEEFIIEKVKRKYTIANQDDSSPYLTLCCHRSDGSTLTR